MNIHQNSDKTNTRTLKLFKEQFHKRATANQNSKEIVICRTKKQFSIILDYVTIKIYNSTTKVVFVLDDYNEQ